MEGCYVLSVLVDYVAKGLLGICMTSVARACPTLPTPIGWVVHHVTGMSLQTTQKSKHDLHAQERKAWNWSDCDSSQLVSGRIMDPRSHSQEVGPFPGCTICSNFRLIVHKD